MLHALDTGVCIFADNPLHGGKTHWLRPRCIKTGQQGPRRVFSVCPGILNCSVAGRELRISTLPGISFRRRLTCFPASMAAAAASSPSAIAKGKVSEIRTVIPNKHGEKLVGVLHDTGSKDLVILCHGFRSSKENTTFLNLASSLTSTGVCVFRFDFAGNGESEGSFQYGNYRREAEDLRSVVTYFSQKGCNPSAIIGHSKGGNVVLLYASSYGDVQTVINVSGRFALERGISGRLGKDFMQLITKDDFIDVKDNQGNFEYRVTKESLMDRLNTDMHAACLSIGKSCRVLTIHGSQDEIVPAEDAVEIAKLVPNHKLHIIEGANHGFTSHQPELASAILEFLQSSEKVEAPEEHA